MYNSPSVQKNILAQEELRNAQSSLKQYQKTIEELEKDISEKRSEILNAEDSLGETVGELELKVRCQIKFENNTVNSQLGLKF